MWAATVTSRYVGRSVGRSAGWSIVAVNRPAVVRNDAALYGRDPEKSGEIPVGVKLKQE